MIDGIRVYLNNWICKSNLYNVDASAFFFVSVNCIIWFWIQQVLTLSQYDHQYTFRRIGAILAPRLRLIRVKSRKKMRDAITWDEFKLATALSNRMKIDLSPHQGPCLAYHSRNFQNLSQRRTVECNERNPDCSRIGIQTRYKIKLKFSSEVTHTLQSFSQHWLLIMSCFKNRVKQNRRNVKHVHVLPSRAHYVKRQSRPNWKTTQ